MVRILAVVNLKGGVGKTTVSVNLAAIWALEGKKILLVDLDPQGSATNYLGLNDDGEGLLLALQRTSSLPLITTEIQNLTITPSGHKLSEAIRRFPLEYGIDLIERCIKRTEGDWTYIVIDCPPSVSVLTYGALKASTDVIVPIEANSFGILGLQSLESLIQELKRNVNASIRAIIPCRAHLKRKTHELFLNQLKDKYKNLVTPPIRESATIVSSIVNKKPVILFDSKSNSAKDFISVIRHIEENLQKIP